MAACSRSQGRSILNTELADSRGADITEREGVGTWDAEVGGGQVVTGNATAFASGGIELEIESRVAANAGRRSSGKVGPIHTATGIAFTIQAQYLCVSDQAEL